MLGGDQAGAGAVRCDLKRMIIARRAAHEVSGLAPFTVRDRTHQHLKILLPQMPVRRDPGSGRGAQQISAPAVLSGATDRGDPVVRAQKAPRVKSLSDQSVGQSDVAEERSLRRRIYIQLIKRPRQSVRT